jgi:hypothetical protein
VLAEHQQIGVERPFDEGMERQLVVEFGPAHRRTGTQGLALEHRARTVSAVGVELRHQNGGPGVGGVGHRQVGEAGRHRQHRLQIGLGSGRQPARQREPVGAARRAIDMDEDRAVGLHGRPPASTPQVGRSRRLGVRSPGRLGPDQAARTGRPDQ